MPSWDEIERRLDASRQMIEVLVKSKPMSYATLERKHVPLVGGVYMISTHAGEVLRAGRTGSLQRRVYTNHLKGDQNGNLPAQLVGDGVCGDLGAAQEWIRQNCVVQFLTEEQLQGIGMEIGWSEYILLGILRPRYCH
jgi:hypothetical protein